MFKKLLFVCSLVVFVSGCKSTLMQPSSSPLETNLASNETQMIFMRSAFTGQAIQASVFDVTSGTPEFIGILSNETKIAHRVTPGERMFMVVGESADFLKAHMQEGKTYYSIASPRMGFWKARFSLHPIRNSGAADAKFFYDSEQFKEIDQETSLVEISEAAKKWAQDNASNIIEKMNKYLPAWEGKEESKRKEATVNKEDHI